MYINIIDKIISVFLVLSRVILIILIGYIFELKFIILNEAISFESLNPQPFSLVALTKFFAV